jgi:hypothetical protein
MLLSQFSAILTDFRRKIGVFLKNQCRDPNFATNSSILNKNLHFFRQILWRKYF